MKFTYKFLHLPINPAAPLSKHPKHPNYQEVIATHAALGWRFIQLLTENPAACATEYVLVFEQPAQPGE